MNVATWITKLDNAANWTGQWREVESLLKRGERQTLLEIARACAGADANQGGRQSVLERIVGMLALAPGRENVQTLAQIFAEWPAPTNPASPRLWGAERARYFASLMAQAQAPRELLELGDWAGDEAERRALVACLIQELVARGRFDSSLESRARALLSGHPLAVLPLQLSPEESDFPALLPRYGVGGSSRGFGESAGQIVSIPGHAREAKSAPFDAAQIESALANWEAQSNGRLAAGVWSFEAPLAAGELGPQTLAALPFEATRELKGVRRIELRGALNVLWSAANGGGAYNAGAYGAWGRLLTWRSAGALAGCDAGAPVAEIGRDAAGCAWFDFAGESAWFYNVAWDAGLVCLRADGQSLAMVAGTDTD